MCAGLRGGAPWAGRGCARLLTSELRGSPEAGGVIAQLLLCGHVTHAQGGRGRSPLTGHGLWRSLVPSHVPIYPGAKHGLEVAVAGLQHLARVLEGGVVLDSAGGADVGRHPGAVPHHPDPLSRQLLERVQSCLRLCLPGHPRLVQSLDCLLVRLLALLEALMIHNFN